MGQMDNAEPVSLFLHDWYDSHPTFRPSRKFIANYYFGTTAFIDEYWRMIHRAAGWAALRAWLLVRGILLKNSCGILIRFKMFVVNRFLTGSEVAHILRHYEGLTNMDSWYTNEDS
jgi:hypothetical protein